MATRDPINSKNTPGGTKASQSLQDAATKSGFGVSKSSDSDSGNSPDVYFTSTTKDSAGNVKATGYGGTTTVDGKKVDFTPSLATYGGGAQSSPATISRPLMNTAPGSTSSYVDSTGYASSLSGGQGTRASKKTQDTEEDFYQKFLKRNQSLIDNIQDSYDAQIEANKESANQEGAQAQQNQNALAAASGLIGSASAIKGAQNVTKDVNTSLNAKNAPILTERAQAVASALQQVQSMAESAYQFERTQAIQDSQEARQLRSEAQQNASNVIKGLAENGVDFDTLSTDPTYSQTYQTLLDASGGDPNALRGIWMSSIPQQNILKSWSDGTTYYSLSQDPVTGKATVLSTDLGMKIPQDWQSTNIPGKGMMFYGPDFDPNDPSTYTIWSTSSGNGGGSGGSGFKVTQGQLSKLISGGFTAEEARSIANDVATYGIDAATDGLSEGQKALIKRTFSGSASTEEVSNTGDTSEIPLTGDSLSKLFTDEQLKTAADDAGYRHWYTDWGTEKKRYIDYLQTVIDAYRDQGYTDKEILKMMQ